MRSKKLLATLIVALILLLTGCGYQSDVTKNSAVGVSNVSASAIKNSNNNKSTTETSNNSSGQSRFIFENTTITTPLDQGYDLFFRNSFIMTDLETGKQYLYLYHHESILDDGGPVIIELGTTVDVNN